MKTIWASCLASRRLSSALAGSSSSSSSSLQSKAIGAHNNSPISYETLFDALSFTSNSLLHLQQIHSLTITGGFSSKSVLTCRLIRLYWILRRPSESHKVFDVFPKRTLHAYNSILKVCFDEAQIKLAFKLYSCMLSDPVALPDAVTFSTIIRACFNFGLLNGGKMVHSHVLVSGCCSDIRLETDILNLYGKLGCFDSSSKMFDAMPVRDSFTWTTMIDGCFRSGAYSRALDLFHEMQRSGIRAEVTTWNTMVAGYARGGHITEALSLFNQMPATGVKPDNVSMCTVLPLFAQTATLKSGTESHTFVLRNGLDSDLFVLSALVDMYSKCGRLDRAQSIFDRVEVRDTALWNSILVGYGFHGNCEKAMFLFQKMRKSAVQPNNITFSSLLSACSHSGNVEQGRQIYDLMVSKYGITPSFEHLCCMVDMFCRAGCFEDASEFIEKMKEEPTRDLWVAFLSSCRNHSSLKNTSFASKNVLKSGVEEVFGGGFHVILSSIFAESGLWEEMAGIRKDMRDAGVKRRTGWSWIVVGEEVHSFSIADVAHKKSEEIYGVLWNLCNDISYREAKCDSIL